MKNGKIDSTEVTLKSVNHLPAAEDQMNGEPPKDMEKKDGKNTKDEAVEMVGIGELFRFATKGDWGLMVLGTFVAICNGIAMPCMIILFGKMINEFVVAQTGFELLNGGGNTGNTTENVTSSNTIVPQPQPSHPQFRFATRGDWCLIILGTFVAMCNGVAFPCMIIIFGNMINELVTAQMGLEMLLENTPPGGNLTGNATSDMMNFDEIGATLLTNMKLYALYFVGLGVAVWLVSYGQMACWGIAAERQARSIRLNLYHTILRQHIGWFDTHDIGELNSRLSDDVNKIKEGLGDKVGAFFQYTAMGFTGFIIGFVYGWKLTLVVLSVSPLMALGAFIMTKLLTTLTTGELNAYAKAGAVAEEVLGSIRTVVAFGGHDKENQRYSVLLTEALKKGIRKGLITGGGMGFMWFSMLAAYGLAFWYGGILFREGSYNVADIMIVFFGVIFGAFALGSAAPNLQSLSTGRGAAFTVYGIIDSVSEIDSFSEEGQTIQNIKGNLQLNGLHFTYPSRKDVKVLNGLSMGIKVGEKVGLVGASGCGKSTVMQLIQRFYDPSHGTVTFDGIDIKRLNIKWFREKIGIVSQEPILFDTTIAENLRFGRLDVSPEEIEAASRQANAYDFIMELPDKFETLVGEGGAQLSGGQKQRIAIARALVRNPTILLLDEATSALDNESESIVQEALEKASTGRTTIIIAHRLSTIRGADRIIAIDKGSVIEEGTHDELMQIEGGVYAKLVKAQTRDDGDDDDFDDVDLQMGEGDKHKLQRLISHTSVGSDTQTSPSKEFKRHLFHFNQSGAKDSKKEDEPPTPGMRRVFALNSPEWGYIVIATIAALINGAIQPVFGFILSKAIFRFHEEEQINKYCIGFLGMAFLAGISFILQCYMYAVSGERLTLRVRKLVFQAMLNQDMCWFDDHKNNTGALCTRLATDASLVQGITGVRIGALIQQFGTMGLAIGLSFAYEWSVTLLIVFGFVPLLMLSAQIQMKIMAGNTLQNKDALENAGKVAVESIENIRTVTSLTRENWFYREYLQRISMPYKSSIKKAHVVGVAFGFSQGILFFIYAACFYFGAYRAESGAAKPEDVFIVFMVLVFAAMAAGQASSFAPDIGKAQAAAAGIFHLLDNEPVINSTSARGETPGQISSYVRFNDVRFHYPTRPDVKVLRGLTLDVNPGQTIALVGSSGCGKSTLVQLIERFYDPLSGDVNLDNHNIKCLNLQWLRSQIGIVSQEPVLFDRTIRDNIAYGDNNRDVPMDEVIAAARHANIHGFIDTLPLKYDTNVGSKGTQLSGGQKQRVAIARALVRNPKILLLDEATSALDTESEKVVQEALDKAREGRTCVVIAHRLSTITNVDKIFVIRRGVVSESGTHSELMANRKFYYRLHLTQAT